MSRTIALIPLRGGSKGIPRKNIRCMAGKPLCYWSIKAAVESQLFDTVVVSTEDAEIAAVVRTFGFPNVCILDRPMSLAQDDTSTEAVMAHCAAAFSFDRLVTIQATSPLTQASDFQKAMLQFEAENADSLVTGVKTHRFFWTPEGRPLNYVPSQRPRRQSFSGSIMENGAFYITTYALWSTVGCRLGGKVSVYEMSEDHAVELDDCHDWPILESLLYRRQDKMGSPIKLLILDVDGVLTDSGMFYSEHGDELKKFNTRDGKGIQIARERGLKTAIITAEKVQLVMRRAQKLQIDHVILGSTDKLSDAKKICEIENISLVECAFIGDDVHDIPLLQAVGMGVCPHDAHVSVQNLPGILRLATHGGNGVVREWVDRYVVG
jgi:YrbI family 3-deoxy-D-manno-octulosonate 8-phosphate phosphatase